MSGSWRRRSAGNGWGWPWRSSSRSPPPSSFRPPADRARPMLQSTAALPRDTEGLADTPFAAMPDTPDCAPLKRAERLNVVFVLAASQLAQIFVVAVVTAAIYLILGLIVL